MLGMKGFTPPSDPAELRRVFGCFPSGVTAVCALVGGAPAGMAASTFVPVSLDPPMVSVCVRSESATWPRLRFSGRLGISVLGGGHEPACRALADKGGDRFRDITWTADAGGAVFVDGAVAWLACRIHDEMPAGDHVIALLRILEVRADSDGEPLVFHRSRFRTLAPAAPAAPPP
jgi:flavin reductase (DIM6/NTAB) family NADH-FMN oxidoreductase RutF